jgi:hypothetical protein
MKRSTTPALKKTLKASKKATKNGDAALIAKILAAIKTEESGADANLLN